MKASQAGAVGLGFLKSITASVGDLISMFDSLLVKVLLITSFLSVWGRSKKVYLKSSVVSLLPSWKVTPLRSTMSRRVFLSSSHFQDSIRRGVIWSLSLISSGESNTAL